MRRGGAPFQSESPTLPVVNPALEATGRWAGGGGGGASQSGPRLSRSFGVCGEGTPAALQQTRGPRRWEHSCSPMGARAHTHAHARMC